ncbi:MAG: mechanosensitive ion channel family protein [Chloroflexales bacterium]|jgi:small conductance mechanosensitive channel
MDEEAPAVDLSSETIVALLTTSLIALVIGALGYFISAFLARIVFKTIRRFAEPTIASFISTIVRIGVLVFTLKMIVDQTGAAGILVILVTAFTAAFAMGSERIAGDLVAGINLFFLRFYRVGDMVTISELQGRIMSISLTHTSLDNGERDLIVIPNSEIFSQTIINHTAIPGSILRATVPVAGDHDREEMVARLMAAAETFEPQLRGPDDHPFVVLEEVSFNEEETIISSYVVSIYTPDYLHAIKSKLLLHIMHTLDKEDRERSESETVEQP